VIQTYHPDHSPQRLGQRLQAELQRQQQWEISPASPIAVRTAAQQSQITHMGLMLDAAVQKAQPRSQLPGKLARLPLIRSGKVQRLLLKVYNFLFKEQRTAQMGTIQAVRESAKLHQQMLEQLAVLEGFQQDFQTNLSTKLDAIDGQFEIFGRYFIDLKHRLTLAEQQLSRLRLPVDGIVQLDQISHSIAQLHQIDARLAHVETALQTMQQQHDAARQQHSEQDERLRYLQSQVAQQRRIQAMAIAAPNPVNPLADATTVDRPGTAATNQSLDGFYTAFEEEFRGSQSIIRERLKTYLPLLAEMSLSKTAPIVDLGCGRGEWLDLLRAEGYNPIGVDINAAMLEQCQARGLTVAQADALTYLQSLPDRSAAGVSGFHIVEHLPLEQLVGLIDEAFRVVQPGGFVLFETPNPQNVLVGSFSFYLDPTHRNPIPMEVLRFILRYSGFDQVVPIWANPSDLPRVVEDSELAKRFNTLFYGFMDYAVIGLKA
jgi:SAM-dependent methyltransferase